MAASYFFRKNNLPFVRIEADGYTVTKPVMKVVGFLRLSGFARSVKVYEADAWDREQGAVALLGVTPDREQNSTLFQTRNITFFGKSVVRWIDGNGEEQSSRILSYNEAPEAFYPTFANRYYSEVEAGGEVQL